MKRMYKCIQASLLICSLLLVMAVTVSASEESTRSVDQWQRIIEQSRKAHPDQALQLADAAVAACPDAALLYAERAEVYLDLSDAARADADLKKALELKPDCVEAYIGLGVEYAGKGALKKSREMFEKAEGLAPDNAEVLFNRAYYYDLGIADLPTAISYVW